MATQKLQIKQTIMDGVQYGLKNVASLLLMVVLYILTFWIPYLNVGTTIGVYKSIIKIGRGEIINPLAIFDKENFNVNLGELFLLVGFMTMGISAAMMFMLIPGIVIGIAWSMAVYFFIDKGLAPHKALKVSYKVTDGEKWTIFWIVLIVSACFSIIGSLFMLIPKVGWLFYVIIMIAMAAVLIAIEGVIYKHFSDKADEMFSMFADKTGPCGCGQKAPEAPAEEAEAEAAAPEAAAVAEAAVAEAPEAPEAPEAAPENPA